MHEVYLLHSTYLRAESPYSIARLHCVLGMHRDYVLRLRYYLVCSNIIDYAIVAHSPKQSAAVSKPYNAMTV